MLLVWLEELEVGSVNTYRIETDAPEPDLHLNTTCKIIMVGNINYPLELVKSHTENECSCMGWNCCNYDHLQNLIHLEPCERQYSYKGSC